MSSTILDISVKNMISKGEKRKNRIYQPVGNCKIPTKAYNPLPEIMNHRKHEGKIYRDANGGIEKTFNRFYGILVE